VKEARAAPGAYAERLRSVMSAHVHCMLDELEGATAHLEVEVLPEAMRAGVIEKRDAYERGVRGLVAEGMKRGEFARTDPALITRAMLGAVNWTARAGIGPTGRSRRRRLPIAVPNISFEGWCARPAQGP